MFLELGKNLMSQNGHSAAAPHSEWAHDRLLPWVRNWVIPTNPVARNWIHPFHVCQNCCIFSILGT